MLQRLCGASLLLVSVSACGASAECQRVQSALRASAERIAESRTTVAQGPSGSLEGDLRDLAVALQSEAGELRAVDTQDHEISLQNMSEILEELSQLTKEVAGLAEDVASLSAKAEENRKAINDAGAAFDAACEADPPACQPVLARRKLLAAEVEAAAEGSSPFLEAITDGRGIPATDRARSRMTDLERLAQAARGVASEETEVPAAAERLAVALEARHDGLEKMVAVSERMDAIQRRSHELYQQAQATIAGVDGYCE